MISNGSKLDVMGRVWFFDTGDPPVIEVRAYEFEPMNGLEISGADWCHEHLTMCYNERELRQLLNVPSDGNFQVIFKGQLAGRMEGYNEPEWEEWFNLKESKYEVIPDDYLGSEASK